VSETQRYFGRFENYEQMVSEWEGYGNDDAVDYPPDHAILFALYDGGDYDGSAFVLFERDGELFEVNGSHCSCYGLEDQWKPERTSWQALVDRHLYTEEAPEAREAFNLLVASRLEGSEALPEAA
jgi:hypothetical protein